MYTLQYKRSVEKDLRKIPSSARKIIVKKITALANEARPAGSVKIHGADNLYRIRHTEYRIIYKVDDDILTILVIKIGHRKEIYRDF